MHEARHVAPGIAMLAVRTPTLPPATHTNVFAVGHDELVLVEPASPFREEIARVTRWIEALCAAGRRLRAILLTHHHPDHAGGAAALAQALGAPIWAHAATAERLSGRVHVDRFLQDGERLALGTDPTLTLTAIHTPGHAPGHLCFLEPASRTLIAGDMVAGVGTIVVDPGDGGDMQAYLDSLRLLDGLDAALLLPAHGLPIDQPRALLRQYVDHRLMREARIVGALHALGGSATLDGLLPLAYADKAPFPWALAKAAAEAHLIKLTREGRVRSQGDGHWLLTAAGAGSAG